MDTNKIVFSAAQPTGSLHLGNLIGAVDLWVHLQSLYQHSFFCIADLHSLSGSPKKISDVCIETACMYLACGLDMNKSHVFVQSHVPQHAELFWLLSSIATVGWLSKMTQYKDKSKNMKESPKVSLLTYPVLMAADVLLYNADIVPVGDDQTQHVELIRDIADKFNRSYGVEYFTLPEVYKSPFLRRVMNLKDPSKKMSKSEESDMSRINLLDSDDLIAKKIAGARTDSIEGFTEISSRKEAKNLFGIAACLSGKSVGELCGIVSSFAQLKEMLTSLLITKLSPIREKYYALSRDDVVLLLNDSASKVREIASQNLSKIKAIMELL